jgi:hypothetical protein
MILFGREVYIGYSMADFSNARSALEQNNINYKYRVTSNGGMMNSSHGRFGGNSNYNTEYKITVKSADYERASYFVNKALHG